MASGSHVRPLRLYRNLQLLGQSLANAPPRRHYGSFPDIKVNLPTVGMGPFIGDKIEADTSLRRLRLNIPLFEAAIKKEKVNHLHYSERHKFPGYAKLLRLFQEGAILEAMTRFYLASKNFEKVLEPNQQSREISFEISPHTIDDMIQILSRLATSPDTIWDGYEQSTPRLSYWIPPNLGRDIDVRQLSVPCLSMHAICSIYDIAGSLGIIPSVLSMAAILQALSKHADEETFTKCVVMLLLRVNGTNFDDSVMMALSSSLFPVDKLDFPAIPSILMIAIVEGYGRIGVPQLGEAMMRRWSKSGETDEVEDSEYHTEMETAWKSATDGKQISFTPPVWINSSKWANNGKLWSALIRSRAFSHDLAGARHWFQRYRREGLASARALSDRSCGLPHVGYLSACTRIRRREIDVKEGEERPEPDTWIENGKTRYASVMDVTRLMFKDGIPLSQELFLMLVNFQLGYGNLPEAVGMISTFLNSKEVDLAWNSTFYRSLFHLHRLSHKLGSPLVAQQLLQTVVEKQLGKKLSIGDLRSLYYDFISQTAFSTQEWSRKAKIQGLQEAMHASIAANDLPLLHTILVEFQTRKFRLSSDAQSIIISFLFPSQVKNAQEEERKNRYNWQLHQNMRRILHQNTGKEGDVEKVIATSRYGDVATSEEYNDLARHFIKFVEVKMCNRLRKVMRRPCPPTETDAEWIHEAYPVFKGRDFLGKNLQGKYVVADKEIVRVVLEQLQSQQRW